MLALNTNLYFIYNKAATNYSDPDGQFNWIEDQLKEARLNETKVRLA